MNSQKVDNQLNLALDSTVQEREKTIDLNVGFDEASGLWELILKYSGDLSILEETYLASVTYLLNGYAIIRIQEEYIDELVQYPQIEFIEKPRGIYWGQGQELVDTCIYQVKRPPYTLTGKGILIAVIDSGIDYAHPEFLNPEGTTRIEVIWDQTIEGNPPVGYQRGTLYTKEQIDEALQQGNDRLSVVPSVDLSGHGTHVAGICAGNSGVAPESQIVIVKLGTPSKRSFPRTTELMEAVNFVTQFALERRMPIAINLSFGNNYGGHDGSSLLETYLNDIASIGRMVISCGSGNEGSTGRHYGGQLLEGENATIQLSISEYESSMNLQIWKSYADQFRVYVSSPSNVRVGPINQVLGTQRFRLGTTNLLLYFGEPAPYNRDQEIYIEWIPEGDYIDEGIWTIELEAERIVTGQYDMWLPVAEATGTRSRFLFTNEERTLTIPSTAEKVITVGAYNSELDALAPFSGRGYTRRNQIKPDISAPGVNILSASPGGGYSVRSGTSMATPFVTGASALLMEYGIINGNDPYLYGEKVKAYLLRGARELPVLESYPNQILGYGVLCLRDSIP
ncbi:MAG: S8 family serine peptidase [Firmicutes bacterium]|uniref:S8 family serine peptidase n=1 Tax=Candidatus Scybalomonas excrementavium TaxID=2840943 RepID=A0A9D9N6H6_9FIRM|nr:S8 family serine peptidase [Candidatus Scybalomonas excrementavium]